MHAHAFASAHDRLEILQGPQGFEQLAPAWRRWIEADPGASPFQHPDWIQAWLDALCTDPASLRLLAWWVQGELQAVLPLVAHDSALPARLLSQWTMVQGPHMVLTELAGSPAHWRPLLQALATQRALRCNVLRLPAMLRPLAPTDTALPPGMRMRRVPRGASAWLDCRGTPDQALERVQRSFRQNLRRLGRRAEGLGPVVLSVADTPEALEAALADFLSLEASGWKGRGGTAIQGDARLLRFYRALMTHFGARGQCRIHRLMLDDRPIAAQFALCGGRQLHLLKIAHDEAMAAIAPGHLLMHRLIERSCADPGLDRISLITCPAWSGRWKPHHTPVDHLTLSGPDLAGRLFGTALQVRQRWRGAPAAHANTQETASSLLPDQAAGP